MEHSKPLAIDLFTGLHGWAEGLIAEGWQVIGFDIENMCAATGTRRPDGVQLVIQDVLTIHGKQFKDADLIVASPPCQEYSYMAMPWSKAKAIEAEYKSGVRDKARLTALFDACFRIQREACEAAGRHIPMVVENVRGAQKWVGRSRWNFGSFHLWGDVPALMPMNKAVKCAVDLNWNRKDGKPSLGFNTSTDALVHGRKVPGFLFDGSGKSFQTASVVGTKQPGISGQRNNGKGDLWFQDGAARHGSKSPARKAASAQIAKIPLPLSRYIARTFIP